MTNIIARLTIRLDVPEEKVVELVGRPDDDSQEWFDVACEAVKNAVTDAPQTYVEDYATSEEVEVG